MLHIILQHKNILVASCKKFCQPKDMVAKKADHSVLRLLQISQQHIESQLERVKHERECLGKIRMASDGKSACYGKITNWSNCVSLNGTCC